MVNRMPDSSSWLMALLVNGPLQGVLWAIFMLRSSSDAVSVAAFVLLSVCSALVLSCFREPPDASSRARGGWAIAGVLVGRVTGMVLVFVLAATLLSGLDS